MQSGSEIWITSRQQAAAAMKRHVMFTHMVGVFHCIVLQARLASEVCAAGIVGCIRRRVCDYCVL